NPERTPVSLIILLFYYVAVAVSRSMGLNDILNPFIAAWLSNILFAAAGFWLIFKADKLR
ncbi:MAG TPA: LptF/LptG family permease, partial [Firmicutes bacterium]|nr:LptF/LptG family permease [Bacillota bacterium]